MYQSNPELVPKPLLYIAYAVVALITTVCLAPALYLSYIYVASLIIPNENQKKKHARAAFVKAQKKRIKLREQTNAKKSPS